MPEPALDYVAERACSGLTLAGDETPNLTLSCFAYSVFEAFARVNPPNSLYVAPKTGCPSPRALGMDPGPVSPKIPVSRTVPQQRNV